MIVSICLISIAILANLPYGEWMDEYMDIMQDQPQE